MIQNLAQKSVWSAPYEPAKWIFWVRIAQIVLTVGVLAIVAYAMSQTLSGSGVGFAMFTVIWTIIWIPVTIWAIPRVSLSCKQNIIVIALEFVTWLWWLVSFSLLAIVASPSGIGFLNGIATWDYSNFYKRSAYDVYDAYSDALDSLSSSSSSGYSSSDYSDYSDYKVPNQMGAWNAIKGGAAVAAINWILFTATAIGIGLKLWRQHRAGRQNPHSELQNSNTSLDRAVDSDKAYNNNGQPMSA